MSSWLPQTEKNLGSDLQNSIVSLIFGPLGAAYGYQVPLIISGAISLALLPLAYAGLRENS